MSRDVKLLHPKLQKIIEKLKADCAEAGLPLLITATFRTADEQNRLYAQGRTTAGHIVTNAPYPRSPHNWGVAFDFCRNEKGREYDDSDGFFGRVGAIGRAYGLSWGGDWQSFPDRPHLELTEFSSVNTLIQLYGTPDRFRASWKGEDEDMIRYRTVTDAPEYAHETLYSLMRDGYLAGDGNPNLDNRVIDLSEDMMRTLVICHRMIKEGV